jgi:YbgC/YbaW family acyl-CoA thioester hydrolase
MRNKISESKVKVRFHDCDPYNHLNNSKYIDYVITAREDQLLDDYNLDIYDLARVQNLGWVVSQTQISYLTPAYLMEEVVIQTQLIAFSDRSLSVEALMWDNSKQTLKAVMWTKLVHFNLKTQQTQGHSEDLQQLFEEIVNPMPQPVDFETRVKQLKPKKL